MEDWRFEKEVKKLKKIFNRQIKPALARHEYFVSRNERRRSERNRATKRWKKLGGGG